MTEKSQLGLDHAWRYFALHSNQRISVFNFFIILTGLNTAALGATFQASPGYSIVGIALGLTMVLVAFVFWKLDQRTSFLVKHAETAIAEEEVKCLPATARLFVNEPSKAEERRHSRLSAIGMWTYGTSFKVAFLAMAIIGLVGSGLSALRWAHVINWEKAQEKNVFVLPVRATEGRSPHAARLPHAEVRAR